MRRRPPGSRHGRSRSSSPQTRASSSPRRPPAGARGSSSRTPPAVRIMSGTGTVSISVYAAGNLCLEREPADHRAHARDPEPLPVRRRSGAAARIGPSQIGTSAAKIAQADIVGGCTVNGNAKICSNSAQSKVYANSYISTAQSLTKPAINAASTYAGGDWNHPVCSTGSFTFDGNGTRDSSVGSITLLPGKRLQLHRLQELRATSQGTRWAR